MDRMQSPEPSRRNRRVVVVGGGVAGSLIAKNLQFVADVTLIDPKEYFEIPWASLRSMVEPSFGDRSVINHGDYLTNGRVITSRAIKITDTEVLTSEGRFIAYDYLIIATGHDDPAPLTKTDKLGEYEAELQKIKSAQSILIIGGGPVGVELAGEIAADFPEKKITLVHRGSRLLEFIGPKASDKTLNWLRSKGVEVKLDQSVDLKSITSSSDGTRTYTTSERESISADCHFLCTGKPVASEWLKHTILKDNLDQEGMLIVDQHMRVKGRDNMFAIGDITNVREIKQGYLAQKHALVAAKNLKLLMEGGTESKMAVYEPRSAKTIVSLGRRDAVAQFSYTTIIGLVPGLIKSRDLFVGKTRKLMGLKPDIEYS
ncbi:apoptosis-inducing factor 2-like [Punica granatum]|uniref:FAD/NAD(P)-binding domain-containing protein n=2 Tax=Punica granatum TaxID=22663 RepID=A0A218WLC1_PUNGR|nr:apoptosis-inducing factor 2-like [Punica granatum]OWM73624.1 hypothetical protein CDL15_Pgr026723 [Punica granatum]PKI47073.1 hypothetical protein CRG98_032549 [Punica granatum]